jgi:cation diffusion facilitator family transporter
VTAAGGPVQDRGALLRYARLAIATAVVVIVLKAGGAWLTGSVGLLSDALESGVNLVAAIVAYLALRAAARPPDEVFPFGRSKAEYFSAAVEGTMIFVAAIVIVVTAVQRLLDPQPLEQIGVGLAIIVVASVLNGAVGILLLRRGRQHRSITLEADGKHLLTDVWTSVGVLVGVGLVALTGWDVLDPVVALLVGLNIVVTGVGLLRQSGVALLDSAIPAGDRRLLDEVIARYEAQGIAFHALRTRVAGQYRFVYVHVLVPGEWTVQRGHDLLEQFEGDVAAALPGSTTFTHLEPIEDPVSFADQELGDARFRADP